MGFPLKQRLGAALIDWPRFEWNLRGLAWPGRPAGHWTRIANREDSLEVAPDGSGVDRAGRWTSRLHGSAVFPALARRLMRQALDQWPISLAPDSAGPAGATSPDVAFVIGHRGLERLPHLLLTLRSIAAQSDAAIECVVVEQSASPEVGPLLPGWVRHVHTPLPDPELPYARSWALNVGARVSRARLVVFHDGDLVMPRRYAAELLRVHAAGFEVINLKRFVFYLNEGRTEALFGNAVLEPGEGVETVVQNLQAGASVAADRTAFFALGGFDESFVGWGGEDDEFWDRAEAVTRWGWGYLPGVHLWHPPQPGKDARDRSTKRRLEERLGISRHERVQELVSRAFGGVEGPDPAYAPAEGASS